MANPNGAIQAISSAAATFSALEIAFLGYWGYGSASGQQAWEKIHLCVLGPGALSLLLLALVPYIATKTNDEEKGLCRARWLYLIGIIFLLASLCMAVYLTF